MASRPSIDLLSGHPELLFPTALLGSKDDFVVTPGKGQVVRHRGITDTSKVKEIHFVVLQSIQNFAMRANGKINDCNFTLSCLSSLSEFQNMTASDHLPAALSTLWPPTCLSVLSTILLKLYFNSHSNRSKNHLILFAHLCNFASCRSL